jgi:hypothetical protein
MRNINDVINALIAAIPADKEADIARLKSIRSSIRYTAPEMQDTVWNRVGEAVNDLIPSQRLTEEWEIVVVAAWIDKTQDEVRVAYYGS